MGYSKESGIVIVLAFLGNRYCLNKNPALSCRVSVPGTGFEPAHLAAPPPEDGASTNFATRAFVLPGCKFISLRPIIETFLDRQQATPPQIATINPPQNFKTAIRI